jgi:hypothetical protein
VKIIQATPRCGPPSWLYVDSLTKWAIYHANEHRDIEIALTHPGRILPIDVARNLLVEQFLKTDGDYLWMIDQDAVFLPRTLDRLLSRKLPIVGALEMMRLPGACWPMALKGPPNPDTGQYRVQSPEVYAWIAEHMNAMTNGPQLLDEVPIDSLLETTFTGCHCLLIRRDVLEDMEPPWFQGYNPGGEDQYFCEKAGAAGVPVYVDLSVLVGHAATDRTIGAFDFMAAQWFTSNKDAMEQQEAASRVQEWRDA